MDGGAGRVGHKVRMALVAGATHHALSGRASGGRLRRHFVEETTAPATADRRPVRWHGPVGHGAALWLTRPVARGVGRRYRRGGGQVHSDDVEAVGIGPTCRHVVERPHVGSCLLHTVQPQQDRGTVRGRHASRCPRVGVEDVHLQKAYMSISKHFYVI